ncbi:MAG: hypothetical protein OWS74_02600, partial [Firmicutes bacterium]|nr:hypothetical protein [Bacillota bacterium]
DILICNWNDFSIRMQRKVLQWEAQHLFHLIDISGQLPHIPGRVVLPSPFLWKDLIRSVKHFEQRNVSASALF